jgi:hypothetical protein
MAAQKNIRWLVRMPEFELWSAKTPVSVSITRLVAVGGVVLFADQAWLDSFPFAVMVEEETADQC